MNSATAAGEAAPTVSVVIPCYNAAPYIRQTIQSALDQTYPPLEIIVIDDGSTDGSGDIAESFGAPVRVLRQANSGESVGRNRGMDEARGSWIALLDADDVFEPQKLQRQVEAITTGPADLVCVYVDVYTFTGEQRLGVLNPPELHARPDYHLAMLCEWSVTTTGAIVRADVAREVRFPEDMRDSEDMVFYLNLRRRGPFLRIAEPLAGYRRGPGQQTASPQHLVRSVSSRFGWLERHRQLYSPEEQASLQAQLSQTLIYPYRQAIRHGNTELEEMVQDAFFRIHPTGQPIPRAFRPGRYYRLEGQIWTQATERLAGWFPWLPGLYQRVVKRRTTARS